MIRALCDSGTSSSIMEAKLATKLRVRKDSTTTWNTAGGPLSLNDILVKHIKLFDGMLGRWRGIQHKIELKDPSTTPIPCRPYPVPVKNKETLKLEIFNVFVI